MYAEIEGNKCEGMIPIGSLKDDYYMLDEDNYQIIGRRYGKCYKLGDPIQIRVRSVDMLKKLIDFDLVDENAEIDSIMINKPRSKQQQRRSNLKKEKKESSKEKKSSTKEKKSSTKEKKSSTKEKKKILLTGNKYVSFRNKKN